MKTEYDVLIIGSGASGGMAAHTLTKLGVKCIMLDAGALMLFPHETADIRAADWKVRPAPADLQDRRVEITGPVDRKMVVNALNSGAKCFMADFEDATAPHWANLIEGQINLRDANKREIDFTDEKSGKNYSINEDAAVLIVRPRGWHLDERHVLVNGVAMSASLFDFGLYLSIITRR